MVRATNSLADPEILFEALAPTDSDYDRMLQDLGEFSRPDTFARRLPPPTRNDLSVASVVCIGGEIILLGADLECSGKDSGWNAVHKFAWRDRGNAIWFKIPHHGSKNGHLAGVWTEMLMPNVFAALTPWSRGSKLPTSADSERILGYTPNAYAAAKPKMVGSPRRLRVVERELRDSNPA